jgi:hypothetical protein
MDTDAEDTGQKFSPAEHPYTVSSVVATMVIKLWVSEVAPHVPSTVAVNV